MSFNADAYREAAAPWVFTAGGRSWTALPVSAPAVDAFRAALRDASSPVQRDRALHVLLRRAFPWRLSYWIYGDPLKALRRLTVAERDEALGDFFGYLEGRARRPLPPRPTMPSGSASSGNSSTATATRPTA